MSFDRLQISSAYEQRPAMQAKNRTGSVAKPIRLSWYGDHSGFAIQPARLTEKTSGAENEQHAQAKQ
jgi:hypothetical protein